MEDGWSHKPEVARSIRAPATIHHRFVRLMDRTLDFLSGNAGSIPARSATHV